jgi:CRISPR-associated protein Csb2
MLAITVEFLHGRFYARDTSEEKLPEWPPHPARMFAALVSAAAETRELDRFRPLLMSIEGFDPPDIAAIESPLPRIAWNSPNRLDTRASKIFVRINDPESKSGSKAHPIPALRTLQQRYLPSVRVPNTGGESSVHYIWPHDDLSSELRSEMEKLCGRVGYLGSSRSKVRVFPTSNHPTAAWKYATGGKEFLRVPRRGTLAELEASFKVAWGTEAEGNRSYPPAGTDAGYERVAPEGEPVVEPRASNFMSVFLFQLRGPRLHLESTLFLTQKFRGALSQGGMDSHWRRFMVITATTTSLLCHSPLSGHRMPMERSRVSALSFLILCHYSNATGYSTGSRASRNSPIRFSVTGNSPKLMHADDQSRRYERNDGQPDRAFGPL